MKIAPTRVAMTTSFKAGDAALVVRAMLFVGNAEGVD